MLFVAVALIGLSEAIFVLLVAGSALENILAVSVFPVCATMGSFTTNTLVLLEFATVLTILAMAFSDLMSVAVLLTGALLLFAIVEYEGLMLLLDAVLLF